MEQTEEQALLKQEDNPDEEVEVEIVIPGKNSYRTAFVLGSIFGLLFGIGQIFLAEATVGISIEASQLSLMLGLSTLIWGLGTLIIGVIGGRQSGRVSTGLFACLWAAVLSGVIIFVSRYLIAVQRINALDSIFNPDAVSSTEFIKVIAIFSIIIWCAIVVTGAMLGSLGGLLGRNLFLRNISEEYILVDEDELDEEAVESNGSQDEGSETVQEPEEAAEVASEEAGTEQSTEDEESSQVESKKEELEESVTETVVSSEEETATSVDTQTEKETSVEIIKDEDKS